MLAVRDSKEDIIRGLEADAIDYVVKPFDSDELRARIDAGKNPVELEQSLVERIQGRVSQLQGPL